MSFAQEKAQRWEIVISHFPFNFIHGISARFDTFPETLLSKSSPIIPLLCRNVNEFYIHPAAYFLP